MTEFQGFLVLLFIGFIWLYGTNILKYIVNKGGAHLYFLTFATICGFCSLPSLALFLGYISYLTWPMETVLETGSSRKVNKG